MNSGGIKMNQLQEQCAELNRLDKKMGELYHQFAIRLGISQTAFWILYCLCESGEIYTQNSLAELLCFPKQTVNSAINNLIKEEYVYLRQMAAARNSKEVHLTEKGTAFCQDTVVPLLNAEQKSFSRLTETERQIFLALYEKQYLFFKEELDGLS